MPENEGGVSSGTLILGAFSSLAIASFTISWRFNASWRLVKIFLSWFKRSSKDSTAPDGTSSPRTVGSAGRAGRSTPPATGDSTPPVGTPPTGSPETGTLSPPPCSIALAASSASFPASAWTSASSCMACSASWSFRSSSATWAAALILAWSGESPAAIYSSVSSLILEVSASTLVAASATFCSGVACSASFSCAAWVAAVNTSPAVAGSLASSCVLAATSSTFTAAAFPCRSSFCFASCSASILAWSCWISSSVAPRPRAICTASLTDKVPPNTPPARASSVPAPTTPRIVGVSANALIPSASPVRCSAIFSASFSWAAWANSGAASLPDSARTFLTAAPVPVLAAAASAASLAATFVVIFFVSAPTSCFSTPVRPAIAPRPAPARIISRFLPPYSCAFSAVSSAFFSSTPASFNAFLVSS